MTSTPSTAAPTPHAGGADWFRQSLHALGLAATLAPFRASAIAHVAGSTKMPHHIQESLVVAACLCAKGTERPSEETILQWAPLVETALASASPHNPVASAARLVKNLRPYLMRCEAYASILKPFEVEARRLGLSPHAMFSAIYGMRLGFLKKIPPELRPIWNDISIAAAKVRSHADLWNKAAIVFPEGSAILVDRLPGAVYEALCARLNAGRAGFYDRKGKQFEALVAKLLTSFFAGWQPYRNAIVAGEEKDILLVQAPLGLACEAKALRLRPPSADWNQEKVRRDLQPLRDALLQTRAGVQALRTGAALQVPSGITTLPACSIVRGLVVTDNEYTHYCTVALEELGLSPFDWFNEGIVVLSWLDLKLLLAMADCPSLVIDYWVRMRGLPAFRRTDEVEAWMGYEMEPMLGFGRFLNQGVNVVLSGVPPWPETPEEMETFLDKHRVLWIRDWKALAALDRGGKSNDALQMVRSDFEVAARLYNR